MFKSYYCLIILKIFFDGSIDIVGKFEDINMDGNIVYLFISDLEEIDVS